MGWRFTTRDCYNPDNGDIYVTNSDSHTVSVIDGATNTVIDTISWRGPVGIAYNPDNDDMYVAMPGYLGSLLIVSQLLTGLPIR